MKEARQRGLQKQKSRCKLSSLRKVVSINRRRKLKLTPRIHKAKKEEQISKFLEIFKKIEINILFAEAINQMPNYAKFMKEILSKKKKIVEEGIVNLTATCSAIIQRSLLAKMKDPGSFTIPCSIRKYEFKKALCDTRASIKLMPLSVVQRLSLGELAPTTIILQMADRSMTQP